MPGILQFAANLVARLLLIFATETCYRYRRVRRRKGSQEREWVLLVYDHHPVTICELRGLGFVDVDRRVRLLVFGFDNRERSASLNRAERYLKKTCGLTR